MAFSPLSFFEVIGFALSDGLVFFFELFLSKMVLCLGQGVFVPPGILPPFSSLFSSSLFFYEMLRFRFAFHWGTPPIIVPSHPLPEPAPDQSHLRKHFG